MAARKHYDSIAIDQMDSDETDDEDVFFNDPRRNLLKDFSKTSSNETNLNVGEEHMKVYLRIRPLSEDEQNRQEDQSCVEVEDDNHVVTHAPKDSHTFKNCTHGLGKTTHKFTFSKIFSETTSQKDLFDQTMLNLVKDFISGQNCLVFTYGVTSSGKTYTIQGQPSDAGVLPRALDVLFNSINGKQVEGMKLKPNMFTDVMKLSSVEEEAEKNFKEKTLKMSNDDEPDVMSLLGEDASDITNTTTCSESSNVSYANSDRQKASLDPEDLLSEIEERVREETAVSVEDQGSIRFSIWVSFAEIYNEQIFDLLVPIPKKKNVRRPVLKLSDDKKGSPYIKGLKEIHVTSADEAYKLLTIGKQNLRTACTKLNHQSSRSHCIFNIKIVRVMDVDDPHVARVSMLSLCDLAGSERYSKTQSNGERLKEAGNINTSLMTLGRCIEMLRYNQHHKEKPKIIPFRDSKLTRLFQNFFSGRGKAAMIVNVNQCASMFDETLHVFKFSAIAKQVVVIQKPDPPPRPKLLTISVPPPVESVRAPSIAWATPGQLHTAEKIPLPEDEEDNLGETDEVAELVHVIEEMEKEIRGLRKEMRHQEGRIREEVCQEMMKQFVAIENECRERIRWTEELAEETMEKRIKVFTDAYKDQRKSAKKGKQSQRMEDEDDEWVSSILLHQEKVKVEEKEKEVSRLQQQIKELEQQDSKETTKDDQTSVVEEMSHQLTELRNTVSEKDEEIDKLNEMLEEAGETFAEKETELSRLHNLISGHEDKIKEQGRTIADLEEALRESRLALDNADQRLTQQEDAAATQNEAKAKLQEELKTVKGCVGFLEQTVKQKEEEVRVWKSRCQRAEEDSIKQEQALINGYKAEISTLKQQMLEMKSNSSVTKASSLLCDSSPRKKGMDGEKDTFYQNLSIQLKELQAELDRNSAVTLELQQALETARAVSEDLDQQLGQEKDGHKETRAQLSQLAQENEELQQLKIKVTQLENSFEDREQNLASKVEQNLRAEGLIAELEEELRTLKSADYPDQVVRLEKEVATLQESLVGKEKELETLTGKVEELQTVNVGLRDMVNQTTADLQAKDHILAELTAKVKVSEDMKQGALSPSSPLSSLQRRMREIRQESEATKNELTTTVKERKKLQGEFTAAKAIIKEGQEKVHQLTSHIKDLEFQLDESQIDRSHIMEDQRMAEDKAGRLQVKVEELEKCVEDRNTQLAKLNSEMEQLVTKGEKEDEIERQNIEGVREELEQAKQKLDTKTQLAEDISEELQKVKDELKQISKKGSKGSKKVIERLEGQCEELGQTVKDREVEIERLKAELSAIQSSADTGVVVKSNQIDSLHVELQSLRTEMSVMEKKIADRDHAIKDLNELYEQNQKELDEKDFTLRTLRKEKEKASGESERAITEKLTKLQEDIEAKTERISELEMVEEKTKQLEDEIANLRQKLSELENVNEKKEQVENELEQKAQRLSELETVKEKKEQLENELASLKDKLNGLENVTEEKKQLQKDLEGKAQRLSELEEKKVQLENELASLRQNLNELETVKDENEQVTNELTSLRQKLCEFKTLQEEKEGLVKELEDNSQRLSEMETLKEKLIQLQEELDCKEKKMSELKMAREKDEVELKTQAEEISKLTEQVEVTESRIKNLMTEKSDLEKKAESLEEGLHGKDHQLEELRKVLTDLQNETKMSSNETNSELSKVKMELAETKSALHMTNTLHQRAKKELLEKTKHVQELEEMSKVRCEEEVCKKAEIEEDMAAVKGKLVEFESLKHDLESRNQTVKCLNSELEAVLTKVGDLTSQNADRDKKVQELEGKITEQSEQSKIQLQQEEEKLSALVKACEEKSSIIDSQAAKIKELARDNDKSDVLVTEVGQKIKKIEELTNTVNQLETRLHNSEAGQLPCSSHKERQDFTRQLEDLQNALERERVKSDEYHKLLEEMRVKACLSPGSESNSVRRLRKDKIDADNALLEAKCKISSLERRLAADSNLQISPRKYKDEESQKLKLELQECHQKIQTLEGQVRHQERIFSSPRQREGLQQGSVTSPTVHRELNRSQEREQTLRRQLQQASTNLQELGHKVSDLEDQLSHKVKAIQDAEDTIQALKNPVSRSGRPSTVAEVCRLEAELKQRWGQIQELQSDLIRRDEKLSAKSQALKDFKISMERERNDFEAALRDAKANESLIEMLKNAITEQEETMEKQDSYLHRKEEEIRSLSQELERYTDKYRQVLETSGDSGRRMIEMTRENARQVTEHSQQLKEQEEKVCRLTQTLQEQETTVRKLTEDKEKLSLVLKENNKELKDLEKLLSESRTETENMRERLSSNTESKSDTTEKAEHEAAILQVKIREKEHALRDSQRSLRRLEEDLNKAQQQANHSETELVKVKQALEEKESQLKTWRTERDNLVAGLEGIMKKQQKEICDLRDQVKVNQRGRHHDDSIVSPSKSLHTSHHEDNTSLPPARPPAPARSSFRNHHQDDQDMTPVKSSHKGPCRVESTSSRSSHSKHHHGDQTLSPARSAHKAHHQGSVTLSPVIVKEEVPSGDSSSSDDRLKSPHPGRERTHRSHRESSRKMSTDQCPLTKTPITDAARSHRSSSRRSRKRRSVSESALELPAKKRDNFDATFASEESSISDHVQIDATPPVAARNLRKSRKKQGHTDSEGKENTGPSSSRRTRRGTKGTEEPGLGRIGSIVSAIKNSSLTRSAKKLLDDISESPVQSTRDSTAVTNTQSTPDSHYVEVEDQGTQMSGGRKDEQQRTKRSRKRHQLYNESLHISEPLEGGLFVPTTPTNDVHGIVLRKLRTRKH